jgi:hypothetical protein
MKVLLVFLILFDISSAQTPAFTHNRFRGLRIAAIRRDALLAGA